MNKVRIIPTVLFRDTNTMKGKNFKSWRVVGSVMQSIKLYSLREVDELIFLDVTATKNKEINYDLINDFAKECFMPVVVGGGIRNINDIENILKIGADRVCINTALVENIDFVKEAIKIFGVQCIIGSIDYKKDEKNKNFIWTNSGGVKTKNELFDFLKKIEDIGLGELLLTSIDHDGVMKGYDNTTLKKVNSNFDFKVIASGGAGKKEDVYKTIKDTSVSAISCSSIFHFTENTPLSIKRFLKEKKINVRI